LYGYCELVFVRFYQDLGRPVPLFENKLALCSSYIFMNLIFFDHPSRRSHLKPFTLTRPVAAIRTGILTLGEKWRRKLSARYEVEEASHFTEDYLAVRYPIRISDDNLLVNTAFCPDDTLAQAVAGLGHKQVLMQHQQMIAARVPGTVLQQIMKAGYESGASQLLAKIASLSQREYSANVTEIHHLWDIFLQNGEQISKDFSLITQNRKSYDTGDPHTIFYGDPKDIFIDEGASIRAAVLNAEGGPIYVGKNATIHENAVVKGPVALMEGSHINAGSKIREATTIGPNSKMGGEVKNVVVFGNSNKGHEGFLGNSVVGEWCNFGADTNNSNLKNNYQPVKLWNYGTRDFENTGELFCGLMMGDHSKCGINTMFNTGTVVGVSANIFGAGYQKKFIPSFTWGGAEESNTYRLEKALEVARNVMHRKGLTLSEADSAILKYIFENRKYETKNAS